MEYVYAALILSESGDEINEANVTDVLEAAGVDVEESRVKALIAALEDVDIEEAVAEATAVPATTGGSAEPTTTEDEDADEADADDDEADAEEADDAGDDDEDDEASGEGLGELFG